MTITRNLRFGKNLGYTFTVKFFETFGTGYLTE